ncbi:hypothetical protein Taro_033133 [Colocasia esculenta]|uniref:Uncharacterized protein n=1 Tax=Colocasia esculenta TaxID=4460 RepID=A0A843VUH4_COLES|nr:hypothetical protein [Colocasia esculenta]
MGIVDCSVPCPPPKFSDPHDASKQIVNPEADIWKQYDNLVMTILMTSVTEAVLPLLVGHSSAASIWSALAKTYGSSSKARVLQLRLQLQQLKKGAFTISDYLQRAKYLQNCLAITADPVSNNDMLLYVLGGLGSEYESFVTAIMTRMDAASLTLDDIQGMLLNQEILLQQHHQNVTDVTTNLARTHLTPDQQRSHDSSPRTNSSGRGRWSRGRGNGAARDQAGPLGEPGHLIVVAGDGGGGLGAPPHGPDGEQYLLPLPAQPSLAAYMPSPC